MVGRTKQLTRMIRPSSKTRLGCLEVSGWTLDDAIVIADAVAQAAGHGDGRCGVVGAAAWLAKVSEASGILIEEIINQG